MALLPCPNPVCPHQFSEAEVQRSASLKCPRCGHVFQLRTGSGKGPERPKGAPGTLKTPPAAKGPKQAKPLPPMPQPAPPAPKPAIPRKGPPLAPSAPPMPLAAPPVPPPGMPPPPAGMVPGYPPPGYPSPPLMPPPPPFVPAGLDPGAGPLIHSRVEHNDWGWKHYLVLGLGALLVGGGLLFAILSFRSNGTTNPDNEKIPTGKVFVAYARNLKNENEQACKIIVPEQAWQLDTELRNPLNAGIALRQTQGDVWFAVAAKDYGFLKPRDAELMNVALERLQKMYPNSLEVADKSFPCMVGGQPGQKLEFKGVFQNVAHRGEVYMTTYQGFGYWMFVGGPTVQETVQAMSDLDSWGHGLVLSTNRRGWREQPPRMETFAGVKHPVTVTAPEGSWEKFPAFDQDPLADLFLLGRYLKEKSNTKNASLMVLVLDKQPDLKEAAQFARDYFTKERTAGGKDQKIESLNSSGDDLGEKTQVGNKPGRIMELKLLLGEETRRFFLLAVVNEPEKVYAVVCECAWESRQIWQQEFRDIIGTLNIK